jgi:DNA-binding transcriptional LysR family regulator
MFAQCYPDIEIAVETGARPVDLKREPIDLAIRHGLGKYPGLESTWIIAPEFIVDRHHLNLVASVSRRACLGTRWVLKLLLNLCVYVG